MVKVFARRDPAHFWSSRPISGDLRSAVIPTWNQRGNHVVEGHAYTSIRGSVQI